MYDDAMAVNVCGHPIGRGICVTVQLHCTVSNYYHCVPRNVQTAWIEELVKLQHPGRSNEFRITTSFATPSRSHPHSQ